MKVHILTKNPGKRLAAENIFKKYNIETEFIDKEYPEIQADTSLEIAKFSALAAAKELNIPVIREDHSLFINFLGMPGPYTSYIEKRLPAEKVLEIMHDQEDRTGYFEVATVYAQPDGLTKEYIFEVPMEISKQQKGELQSGWNRIISLQGDPRTLAEYPEEERVDVWSKNYEKIAKWLTTKKD